MNLLTPADEAAAIAAADGLKMTLETMYEVIVTSNGIERYRSTPMTFENASKQMAKVISVQMTVMGYKQSLASEAVTLTKGALSVRIHMQEARK